MAQHEIFEIASKYIPKLKPLPSGKEAIGLCAFHEDTNPSFSINLESGLWCCFACDAKGNIFQLQNPYFKPRVRPIEKKEKGEPMDQPTRTISATYDYHDKNGDIVYQKVRYMPKSFSFRKPDPTAKGKWISGLDGVERVLFNLPALLRSTTTTICFCEGEKDALSLSKAGFLSTCAGGANDWSIAMAKSIAKRNVVLFPHNDAPGYALMAHVKYDLVDLGCIVKIVDLDFLPYKGDVSDYMILPGANRDSLLTLIWRAPQVFFPEKDGLSYFKGIGWDLEREFGVSNLTPIEIKHTFKKIYAQYVFLYDHLTPRHMPPGLIDEIHNAWDTGRTLQSIKDFVNTLRKLHQYSILEQNI